MVEAEGKKSLGRFPFGQTNRRALRLQAQGSTVAPSGARRNPAYDRVPRVQFPPPCWPTKKNRPPDGFSGCYGGGGGNRTRVRKHSTDSSTYLALPFNLTGTTRTCTLCTSELP